MSGITKKTDLPTSWELVPLGEFVVNEKGKKPKKESKEKTSDCSIPYIDIAAFEEGIIKSWTNGEGCRLCYEDDFLMVWDGSRSGLVGKGMSGALGSTLVRINFPGILNDYAFYFLRSKFAEINSRAKGVGIPHVDPNLLWNYGFPIPPTNEQKRIVTKIEELFSELDKGIGSLKTARAQLKVYRQAILKHAFEGKLTADWREKKNLSSNWQISELGKCGKWQGGGTPSKSVPSYWENGNILWVSPKDMKTRTISDTQQKITEYGVQNSPAKMTSGVAVLFVVRSGILRRILPIAIAISGVTMNQDMQAVVPSQHTPEFLYWYCEANEQTIRHECSKDGTTVESIDVGALKKFSVPVPTPEEQDEIVRLIEAQISVIENIEATIETELQKSEALRQAILKKAFSGQLVPQDPADEPASVLLERIRAEKIGHSAKKNPKEKRRAA